MAFISEDFGNWGFFGHVNDPEFVRKKLHAMNDRQACELADQAMRQIREKRRERKKAKK